MISVFKVYLQSLVPKDLTHYNSMREMYQSIEQFSETVNIRKVNYKSREELIDKIVQELEKQKDFYENLSYFYHDLVKKQSSLHWTPEVEYNMFKSLQGKGISIPEQILLVGLEEKQRSKDEWRKFLHSESLPLLSNKPFQLREPRNEWTEFPSGNRKPLSDLCVKTLKGWLRFIGNTGVMLVEPEKFKDAIQFCTIPNSDTVLALTEKNILVSKFDQEVQHSFPHELNEVDYIDCFTLKNDIVIVQVGKRNMLTGGLSDETLFSFRVGEELQPYTLTETENELVELVVKKSDYQNVNSNSTLSGWNDIKGSWVVFKTQQIYLSNDMVCSVLGDEANFFAVFFNGLVKHYSSGKCIKEINLDCAITHAIIF